MSLKKDRFRYQISRIPVVQGACCCRVGDPATRRKALRGRFGVRGHVRALKAATCDRTPKWSMARTDKFRCAFEKRVHPPKDVLVTHDASHALHARTTLGLVHAERLQNRVGHLLDIVRINEHGTGLELLGRAGELAEDEHAIFVDAARAIFLGYEIHSVFERRYEGDVARAIMREEIIAIEAPKVILHRQPRAGREAAVDVANQPIDALLELVISGNLHPARHDDLDQDYAAAQFRITLQSGAKRAQPFRNSLAIIEPVRTQN